MTDEKFMRRVIDRTRRGIEQGQTPFGACVVKDGELISLSRSKFQDRLKGDSHFLFNIQGYFAQTSAIFSHLSDCHLIQEQKLDLLSLHNAVWGGNDATAHAEVEAIREAERKERKTQ